MVRLLPGRRAAERELRLRFVDGGTTSADEATLAAVVESPESVALLVDRLARAGKAAETRQALARLLARAERDESLRCLLVDRLLDGVFAASTTLLPASAAAPRLLLDALLGDDLCPGLAAQGFQEALLHRTRVANLMRLHPSVATPVAEYKSRLAAESGTSLSARMRQGQALANHFREIAGDTPPDTLRRTLAAVATLPLGRPMLFVAAAHLAPLYRQDRYGTDIAEQVIANLDRWCAQLEDLRSAWLDERRAEARRAELPAEDTPEHRAGAYSYFLAQALAEVVESMQRAQSQPRRIEEERPELPDIIYYEKLFAELGLQLAGAPLDRWARHPGVRAGMLALLARIGAVRPMAMRILERTLVQPPEADVEIVELAAVRFAASFLTGFTRQQAWLKTSVVRAQEGQEMLAEVDALLEVDAAIRHALEVVSSDRARLPSVRQLARYVALNAMPAQQEHERLLAEAAEADAPLVRALLDHVAETGLHSAYPWLRRVYERRGELPDDVPERCYRALEATRHVEIPLLLADEILAGSARAERVLVNMGAHGAVDQLRTQRRLADNVRAVARLEVQRAAAAQQATEATVRAIEAASASDVASVEATRLSGLGRRVAAEYVLASADLQVRIVPLMQELRAQAGRLPELQSELDELVSNIASLQGEIRDVRREIDDAVRSIRRGDKEIEEIADRIRRLHDEVRSLRSELDHLGDKLSSLRGDLSSAQRALGRLPYDEQHAGERRRAQGKVEKYAAKIADVEARMSRTEARARAIPDEVRARENALASCREHVARLEAQVAQLNRALDGLTRREQGYRRNADGTRDAIAAVRRAIQHLRQQLAELRSEAESTARDYRARLEKHQADLRGYLARMRSLQKEATAELESAREARGRTTQIGARMAALEQDTASHFAAHERNREPAAEQSAAIDSESVVAEQALGDRRRLEHTVRLNDHVLLVVLDAVYGRTPELRRITQRLGISS